MESIMLVILVISGLVVIALSFSRSVSRTKSATRWLKGYNLKNSMSDESVLELLKRVKYPQKEDISVESDGKIVFKTKYYSYPVEVSKDENGYTTVGLIVNWAKLSKSKRKKVAFDWDNVYQFIKQEVESVESIDAMKAYEKNEKMQKIYIIAGVICVISACSFMFIG